MRDKEKLREKERQTEKDTSEGDCKPERSFEGERHLSCHSSNPSATSLLFISLALSDVSFLCGITGFDLTFYCNTKSIFLVFSILAADSFSVEKCHTIGFLECRLYIICRTIISTYKGAFNLDRNNMENSYMM